MVQVAMVPFARQVLATAKGLGARREAQKGSTPKPVVQGFEPDFGLGMWVCLKVSAPLKWYYKRSTILRNPKRLFDQPHQCFNQDDKLVLDA